MPAESGSTDLKLDPPSEKFVWAIDSLLAEDTLVSVAVLEEILNLGEAPNNLALMSEPRIVPACMRLLRQHCAQSRVFEDDQYGFICIQVISLCVQVDLLRKMDCLKQFVREATSRELQKSALAIVLSQVLFVRSHSNLRAASRTPEAISEPPYSTTVLTPDHAGWLLDRFHRERDLLLRARTTRAEHWSGWSILLYSLWDKLTDGNKASVLKTRLKLQDINCRVAVVKPQSLREEELLDFIISSVKFSLNLFPNDPLPAPIDRPDRREIVKAYLNRFATDRPSLDLSYSLFDWAVTGMEIDRVDQVAPFFNSSINRLWLVMESMRDVPQIGALQINHGLIFADRVIGFLGNFLEGDDQKGASKDMAEPLMNILLETDIISLIAQAFMFPVSDELENLPRQEKAQIHPLLQSFASTIKHLEVMISWHSDPNLNSFQAMLPDWLKTYQRIHELNRQYVKSVWTHGYIEFCEKEWVSLGQTIFKDHLKGVIPRCSNPRCPYPNPVAGVVYVCGRCSTVPYCSHRCQNLHWRRDELIDSHAMQCRTVPPII